MVWHSTGTALLLLKLKFGVVNAQSIQYDYLEIGYHNKSEQSLAQSDVKL